MAAVSTRANEAGTALRTIFFGLLDDVASDPQVTDLAVTCDGRVWADRGNGMRETVLHVPFRSPQVVREYAVQLCAQLGRRLDDACPIADAASPDGIRVHAVIAPLVPQGAAISIRFPDRTMASLQHLSKLGVFPAAWLPTFVGLVRKHATVLITGGTGVGTTTLLEALLAQCDVNERIVTVEEVRELGELGRDDHVSLVTREANVEGVGAISLADLVKATLRMRPDRVVLGECRGAEIVDLLRAFNSGHHGGMTTVHADGVNRVPSRLISLGLLAGVSPQALTMLAAGAFDAVVHLERVNGQRRITQIGELRVAHGELAGTPLAVWNGCHPPRYAAEWGHFIERWGIVPRPSGGG